MIAKKLGIVIAAVLVAAVAGGASAADEEAKSFVDKAAYFSAGGVYAIENVDHAAISGDLSDSGGYDLRLGYFVHHNVGVEFEWQSMVNFDSDVSSEDSVEARMASFNGRYSPLSGRFQPYVLGGMGWFNVQSDHESGQPNLHKSSFAMRFGLGLLTYISARSGVSLEAGYILPLTGDLAGGESFELIPISLSFFFRFS